MRLRSHSLTTILVEVIAFSYLIQLLVPGYKRALWISGIDFQNGDYSRLITVATLHGSLFHLGFNIYALHILGTPVEKFFGRSRYTIILLVSLTSSSLASALFNDPYIASVGASGMVFGLFGALVLISTHVGVAWRGMIGIVLINFALGFIIGGVDWRGHVGGLLGGIFMAGVCIQGTKAS